jgi:hypothetical protein
MAPLHRLHPRHQLNGQQKRSRIEAVRDLGPVLGWLPATDEQAIFDDDNASRDNCKGQKPMIRQTSNDEF